MSRLATYGAATVALFLLSQPDSFCRPEIHMEGEDTDIERWIDTRFAKGQLPPFSFISDEVSSDEFIRSWEWSRKVNPTDEEGVVSRTFTWKDPEDGLEVKCDVKGYTEYRAVEWVLHFRNCSDRNSSQLTHINALDMDMSYPGRDGDLLLHYAEGNKISKADYSPRTDTLSTGDRLHICPSGGRSSEGAFPFFNIESTGACQGSMISVGWSGTWFMDMEKLSPSSIRLSSGMLNTDLFLYPGESIRTPSIAMMFWSGDRMDGHNKFRRLVLDYHSRKIDGKQVEYPLCSGFNYRDPQPFGEYSAITESWAVAMINRYAFFDLVPDVFWLDAGWHTGSDRWQEGKNWASTTGNWTIDSTRFPRGMKPLSEAAHKVGAKFMLWFEPERVVKGTQWAVEHPEWMLDYKYHPAGSEESTWFLFDLGNDEACDWLCKYYGDLIEQNGIDYYRQDFNMRPAVYWEAADEPGRSGMKEIRHIENLYRFWDYLLDRFPGLLIDNCASGGKRLDWETIGRSAPLWRSDYYHYDDPDGYQCHTYGLNFWLPVHGTGILLSDTYSFRSSLSSTLIYNWKITEKEESIVEMHRRLEEYKEVKNYYYEDYYPLSGTGDITGDDIWLAYQMHKPSDSSGIVVAFRREKCPETEYVVSLKGLEPDAEYMLTDSDSEEETICKGSQLMEKLNLHLENPKSSLLIKYKKL